MFAVSGTWLPGAPSDMLSSSSDERTETYTWGVVLWSTGTNLSVWLKWICRLSAGCPRCAAKISNNCPICLCINVKETFYPTLDILTLVSVSCPSLPSLIQKLTRKENILVVLSRGRQDIDCNSNRFNKAAVITLFRLDCFAESSDKSLSPWWLLIFTGDYLMEYYERKIRLSL